MIEDDKQRVDATSAKFSQGVEAGLNSEEDTMNWKAGNELGQELKEEGDPPPPPDRGDSTGEPTTPLFMRDSTEGEQGNAQDEKDAIGE